MFNSLFDVFKFLLPPPDASAAQLMTWRYLVVSMQIVMMFHIAWACGYIPGYPGFATTDVVSETQEEIRENRTEFLESILFELKVKACTETNPQLKSAYNEKIAAIQAKYYKLTAHYFELPNCMDLR